MRLASLGGIKNSLELSEIGAYKDSLHRSGLISCYKCGLLLKANEIEKISLQKNMSLLKAGWFFHAKQRPWCELLQYVTCKKI